MNQPTLFPEEPKKRKPNPPRVKDNLSFDIRPYVWLHGAVAVACQFPISRWCKALKGVEQQLGKMMSLKAWYAYLLATEPRYLSAQSFARGAGQWAKAVPSGVPDHHFQSEQAVNQFVNGMQERVAPPSHVVCKGAEAIRKWREENG